MELFCLHHAGGTTASFSSWRFPGIAVSKLGYRGKDFASLSDASDAIADRIAASPVPRLALYGHSLGAVLAYEVALRLQHTGRLVHVFLAAAHPPTGASAWAQAGRSLRAAGHAGMSPRALEVLAEDLELLVAYPGSPTSRRITVPTTVLCSADDPLVPPSECQRWAGWCGNAPHFVQLPAGGHLFHRTNPKLLDLIGTTLTGRYGDGPPA